VILRHFGDRSEPSPDVPCCDVCDAAVVPDAVRAAVQAARSNALPGAVAGDVDSAIIDVVATADPSIGRTRAVEILRGGRSKVIAKYSYDGLAGYGTFDHLSAGEVLARVDALIGDGRLASTGGMYPKLRVVKASRRC